MKIENENMLNSIDDLKLNVQKNQEAMVIVTEKYDAIRNVNEELHKTIKKLQKEIEEKQGILESLTQGKENLNAILRSKIKF